MVIGNLSRVDFHMRAGLDYRCRLGLAVISLVSLMVAWSSCLIGQDTSLQPLETINLSEKGPVDLAGLVQWAAEVEGFRLMLDNEAFQSAQNKVVFLNSVQVDRKTLLLLVQEVLRSNGFALVDSNVEGWRQVASLPNVPGYTKVIADGQFNQPEHQYVTAVFQLRHISPEAAKSYLQTFVQSGLNSQAASDQLKAIPAARLLIVTEMVKNIKKIEALLPQIDVPQEEVKIEFYKVINLEAKELEEQLATILNVRREAEQADGATVPVGLNQSPADQSNLSLRAASVKISTDIRTNRLIFIGTTQAIEELLVLVGQLDVPLDMSLRTYQFKHIAAKRIDELMKQALNGVGKESLDRIYQSSVDTQTNQLVVSARDEVHDRIASLLKQLDVPPESSRQSPMRFYTLKNVKVADILGTLQSIERKVRNERQPRIPNSGINARQGFQPGGPNNLNNFSEGPPVLPPNVGDGLINAGGLLPGFGEPTARSRDGDTYGESFLGDVARLVSDYDRPEKLIPGEAKITADENTNTLIVVAEPEVQLLYEQLIKWLDRRRPQVLVEAHVVTIDGSDNLKIGVEISGGDRTGAKKLFAFTSYGLSTVDPVNGALKIIPSVGFNGTLVDPDTADVVLQALASHSRARVVTAPKIVVDDNASGILSSVAEEPFASVNATNTVATTSFAGFAQAGTTINVTPHISEGDHLNLEFDILVNSFTGVAAANLPPPRSTDQIVSEVTIPDGYTVIVGGLNRRRSAASFKGIPGIERIPILRRISSLETQDNSDEMLFIFLRPVILRDDKFRDLIHLSEVDQRNACIPGDFPKSAPVLIPLK